MEEATINFLHLCDAANIDSLGKISILGIFGKIFIPDLNREASRIFEELVRRDINTLVLPTAIGELAAVFTKDIGMKEAQEVIHRVSNSNISILEIDEYITVQAIAMYQKQKSCKETLFDCFIMAVAKMLGIRYIFSFDKGYKKQRNGFLLISDLLS
jgi:predicted nucleic acid-binding protein